LFLKFSKK